MISAPLLQPGQSLDGFTVRTVTPVADLRAIAYELEHTASGARLLHLHADDAENLFSISFPTPPTDDTGVPHILEHAVLAGSRKFPVREPFFELVKMSMATFINAMTGADCTYYPVASNVRQDLFNLADVYFDAVFHPLLTEQTFRREGHHLAPADPERPLGELTVSGIVFNEMKGAFSDPETKLWRLETRGLFPDTCYGRESGGEPDAIPSLTYAQLKNFHATFYHPSNAHFFLYGDIPTADFTKFLRDRLAPFQRLDVRPAIARQPRWTAPRTLEDTYPIGADEPLTEKTYLSLVWLTGDAADPAQMAADYVLSLLLFGNEAAPLKKALIAAKLGQDLVHTGAGGIGCEALFYVALKGSEPDRLDALERLTTDTLRDLAAQPFAPDLVAAAFQQAAYHYREVLPQFPLHLLDRVLSAWIYRRDPLAFLRMGRQLDDCRQRAAADPLLFNRLIRERLLDNPHRLRVVLRPDRDWQARQDAAFAARLKQARATFTDDQCRQIAAAAAEVERLAGTPNTPEALASLPQLSVRDLPAKPRHIPTAVEALPGGVTLLRNDVFANGVNYLHLSFDLRGLPADLWPYLPRYREAIAKLGAAGHNYEAMARRIAASTGGIGCLPGFRPHATNGGRDVWELRFSLKALDEQIAQALDVLRDLVFGLDPRDRDRLNEVVVQSLAAYRTELVQSGHRTAATHAARGLDVTGHLEEQNNGLPQLALIEDLHRAYAGRADDLMARIETIRDFLLSRARLTASFTGSDRAADAVRAALGAWTHRLRPDPVTEASTGFVPFTEPPREALAAPVQVAFCAQVMPAPRLAHADAMSLTVGARLVSMDYLLAEVRLKGNAYGAWCRYDPLAGRLELGSFRDPHIARTLGIFNGVTDFVRQAKWSQTDVDRAIIGSAKDAERPIRPGEATGDALQRHLVGLTPAVREQNYDRLKAATPASVQRAALDALAAGLPRAPLCVVAGREKLEAENKHLPAPLAIRDLLR
jgi:Zn-dependent M16 (insulinase) family peptidase